LGQWRLADVDQLTVFLESQPSFQDRVVGILTQVARDRGSLAGAVHDELQGPSAHPFHIGEGNPELLLQSGRDLAGQSPLQAGEAVPERNILGRRGGGAVIRVTGHAARLEDHHQITASKALIDGPFQIGHRNPREPAVRHPQQFGGVQPELARCLLQLFAPTNGQLRSGPYSGGLTGGQAQKADLDSTSNQGQQDATESKALVVWMRHHNQSLVASSQLCGKLLGHHPLLIER
jgi:hypothetical protein